MANLENMRYDFGGLAMALSAFAPGPWGTAITLVPTAIDIIAALVGGNTVEDWSEVDWPKFIEKMDTAERLEKYGVKLSDEEKRHILGLD